MMCYYLNVQFQGQRINTEDRDDAFLATLQNMIPTEKAIILKLIKVSEENSLLNFADMFGSSCFWLRLETTPSWDLDLMHVDWSDLSCETQLFNQKRRTVDVDKFGDKRLVVQKLHLLHVQTFMNLIFVVPCIMLNSEINPTRCNNCVYSSQWLYSTCFGWQFHPSSGYNAVYGLSGRQVYLCCNFVNILVVLSL